MRLYAAVLGMLVGIVGGAALSEAVWQFLVNSPLVKASFLDFFGQSDLIFLAWDLTYLVVRGVVLICGIYGAILGISLILWRESREK